VTRVLIPIGLAVVVLGGWLVLRDGDDKPDAVAPTTATERAPAERPVLPSNQARVRAPYWKKDEVRAATTDTKPELPDTAESAVLKDPRDHVASMLHRSRPGGGGEQASVDLDRAVARIEAKEGKPVSKDRRAAIEKQLGARKQPQEDRVPGASQMRDLREKATCTAPDAQQKYAAMSDADKLRMRQRCGKHGFVPAS
jgi:hypothetical protein